MSLISDSRTRSLVCDLSAAFMQQMYFWGCDVRAAGGNRLLTFGMTRLARASQEGEGTSRYRMGWEGGAVELHGFCAGWYSKEGEGVLFIRSRQALFRCSPGGPLTPGHYESERFDGANREEMLTLCQPLVRWVLGYEEWIASVEDGEAYRERCWVAFRRLRRAQPWLPPQEAQAWMRQFLDSPRQTPRARHWSVGMGGI